MSLREFKIRFEELRRMARDRWGEILPHYGVDVSFLKRRHGPCPCCGGTDRYRYMDEEGNGTWYCSVHRSGSGDGFQLLMDVRQWTLREAVSAVSDFLGGTSEVSVSPARTHIASNGAPKSDKQKIKLRKVWGESTLAAPGDELSRYFSNRGVLVSPIPKVLRLHSHMPYYYEGGSHGNEKFILHGHYKCMLALVHGADGNPLSIHRTYLKDGKKASIVTPDGEVLSSKKVMSSVKGGAIRLFNMTDDRLAIAEGIESALAVHLMTGLPVWSGISSSIMKGMILPPEAKRIYLFGDNDPPDFQGKRAGQDAIYELASRLRGEGRKVNVSLPTVEGSDFLDVFLQRQRIAA